jgi:hypothetical protein
MTLETLFARLLIIHRNLKDSRIEKKKTNLLIVIIGLIEILIEDTKRFTTKEKNWIYEIMNFATASAINAIKNQVSPNLENKLLFEMKKSGYWYRLANEKLFVVEKLLIPRNVPGLTITSTFVEEYYKSFILYDLFAGFLKHGSCDPMKDALIKNSFTTLDSKFAQIYSGNFSVGLYSGSFMQALGQARNYLNESNISQNYTGITKVNTYNNQVNKYFGIGNVRYENFKNWKKIFNHKVPSVLEKSLNSRKISLQTFETAEANSPINLDYFRLTITEMPLNKDGNRYNAKELLKYIRLNFSKLLESNSISIDSTSLKAYTLQDAHKWRSDEFLGAVMQFDTYFDDLGVACTYRDDTSWIFTTISDSIIPFMGDVGTHPVHGHRIFGLREKGKSYEFYSKGVDRLGFIESYIPIDVFEKGRQIWTLLFENLRNDILNKKGKVEQGFPISLRANYIQVKRKLQI